MNSEQRGRFRSDGVCIVGESRAIGCSYFVQHNARLPEYVGQAKRPADFNKLAAGNNHTAASRQCLQRKERRCGAVVHDECSFGACHILT